jgi:hypothetical protein
MHGAIHCSQQLGLRPHVCFMCDREDLAPYNASLITNSFPAGELKAVFETSLPLFSGHPRPKQRVWRQGEEAEVVIPSKTAPKMEARTIGVAFRNICGDRRPRTRDSMTWYRVYRRVG